MGWTDIARQVCHVVDLVCGSSCAGCGTRGVTTPCGACERSLAAMPAMPFAAWPDDGVARRLARAAKFGHWRGGGALATRAAAAVPRSGIELVTWVPGDRGRRARRGGHLPEALARTWACDLGVPSRGLLRRRPGPTQRGRSRAARLANVANAWILAPGIDPRELAGRRILLVDDIRTTGATLDAAARVLTRIGSTVVTFALVAHGPPSGWPRSGVASHAGRSAEKPASCEEFVLTTVDFPADSVLHDRRKDAPRVREPRPP